MKRLFSIYLVVSSAVGFGLLFSSCRGQEDAASGWCRLSCGSTTLASSGFTIEPMAAELTHQCTDGAGPAAKMRPSWRITAPMGGTGDNSSGTIEKSAIAFNAALGGITPYTTNDPDENSGDWHQGIKTPQSEWCSDSCGVARLVFQGECDVVAQSGTITIESGSISSSINVSIAEPQGTK